MSDQRKKIPETSLPGSVQNLFAHLVTYTGQGLGLADLNGMLIYMNPALRKMLDLGQDADVRAHLRRYLMPDAREMRVEAILGQTLAQERWKGEITLITDGGRRLPTLSDIRLIRDEAGIPTAVALTINDLSEQQRQEKILRDSRAKYQALAENIPQCVFFKDRESRYLAVNRQYARDLGLPPEAIIGRDDYDFHPKALADKYRADDRRIMETAQAEEYDECYMRDGSESVVHIVKTPVHDEQGQVIGVCGIFRDVTQDRRDMDALAASEALLAEAQALAHLGNWNLDLTTGQANWSNEEYRLLGYTPETTVASGDNFMLAVHPEDREAVQREMQRAMSHKEAPPYQIEHRVIRGDGERVLKQCGRVVFDATGHPLRMYGTTQDITEQKRSEAELARHHTHLEERVRERTEELARQNQRNALIVNAAMDGFFSATADGRVTDCNDAYCRILGYSREEMLRLRIRDIEAKETAEETAARIEKIVACGHDRFDTQHRRKDGSLIDVEVNVTLSRIGPDAYFFAFVNDISARKEGEAALRRARDAAEQASLAKTEFLSRMSHELRTPLNAILGFAQLLERDPAHPLAPTQRDNVHEILHAGRHLLEMINEVLDLARVESGKLAVSLEPVAIAPLLRECLGLVGPMAEARGLRLEHAPVQASLDVLADRTRFKQVLLNLLSNGVKYNHDHGILSVQCINQGDRVRLAITDTGAGMTAAQVARLFRPFERLDADNHVVEGSGIGLAISKRLIELMHGEIGVESAPGVGSTFWVSLPRADLDSEPPGLAAGDTGLSMSGTAEAHPREVLCIEDNPANLRLLERILGQRKNLRLRAAATPRLGLERVKIHRPALIILDINLPEMDGFDVLRCLRENTRTRDIPVLAVSAHASPKDIIRGKAAGFADYLTKPLDMDSLLQAVDTIIARIQPTAA